MPVEVRRHRTALSRSEVSRPVRLALEAGLISSATTVLDYGCGKGDDLRNLRARGVECFGWDPVHRPDGELREADLVNLGYVVNVIEDPGERADTLRRAWHHARQVLVVAARLTIDEPGRCGRPLGDGHLTSVGTFQRFYHQHELREWIDATLGVTSLAAAPGVFLVFRDPALQQTFAASRFRRTAAVPRQKHSEVLFDRHRQLLEPLMDFLTERGRLPEEAELAGAGEILESFGSLRNAARVIRRVTGDDPWDTIRDERRQDLLVYLALERFPGRAKFSSLPRGLQLDVRAFSGTYRRACAAADGLLFSAGDLDLVNQACEKRSCGKLTRQGLYVHVSALPHLPSILRIYEGCARSYFGHVDGANIIKLNRHKPQVSYLSYPDFDSDPHPALASSLLVSLDDLTVGRRDYSTSPNPPILHRKEEFLPTESPLRLKFERLTRQEEQWGLYEDPLAIGTRQGWQKTLEARGARLRGHRLVRA